MALLFVDTETTGLSNDDRICEVAAVKQRKQKTKRTNAVTVHSHKYVDIDDIFPW